MNIQNTNGFEERRKQFESSKLAALAAKTFEVKPYSIRYRNRYVASIILSYLFNILSASSMFVLVYVFLLGITSYLGTENSNVVSIVFTIASLILLEFFKRDTAKDFFIEKKQFSKTNKLQLSLMFFLLVISVVGSYYGGKELVKQTDTGHQYINPDSLQSVMSNNMQIAQLRADKLSLEEQKNSKGQTLYKVIPAISDISTEILELEKETKKLKKDQRKLNKTGIINYDSNLELKSEYFGIVTIFSELLYLLCIWYGVGFLYNSSAEFIEETEEVSIKEDVEKKTQDNQGKTTQTSLKTSLSGVSNIKPINKELNQLRAAQSSVSQDLEFSNTYKDKVDDLISRYPSVGKSKIHDLAIEVENFDLAKLKKNTRNFHKSTTREGSIKYELAKWKLRNVGYEISVVSPTSINYIKTSIA